MLFLKSFELPARNTEIDFVAYNPLPKMTCYYSYYPFGIFPDKELETLEFTSPITIIYGGNGSGKTTLLNIISEKLSLSRIALYNKSVFMQPYLRFCDFSCENEIPRNSMMITSDDVFNYMLNMRAVNQETNFQRNELFEEYNKIKYMKRQDVVNMKVDRKTFDRNMAIISSSKSKFARQNLVGNFREYSNGENALRYFHEKIDENALYLLDEPENSLSPKMQIQLAKYIEASARGCGCQFIIATHSPFLLAMNWTRIYDLDSVPVAVRKWTEVENVKIYRDFFKEHEGEFEDE